MSFKVKDPSLASKGKLLTEWAFMHMPVLRIIKKRFEREKPLEGVTVGACLHVTKETAALVEVLTSGGAQVALCGSNPLSTQDEVAAALAEKGVNVYAWRGETTEEYYWCINQVIDRKPQVTLSTRKEKRPYPTLKGEPKKPQQGCSDFKQWKNLERSGTP